MVAPLDPRRLQQFWMWFVIGSRMDGQVNDTWYQRLRSCARARAQWIHSITSYFHLIWWNNEALTRHYGVNSSWFFSRPATVGKNNNTARAEIVAAVFLLFIRSLVACSPRRVSQWLCCNIMAFFSLLLFRCLLFRPHVETTSKTKDLTLPRSQTTYTSPFLPKPITHTSIIRFLLQHGAS